MKEVLGICSHCRNIRINDKNDLWLSSDADPKLYQRFLDRYEGRLSHGICPSCMNEHFPEYCD